MTTRRSLLIGSLGMPLVVQAALAARGTNAALLKLTMSVNKSTVPLDGEFRIVCTLEAREKFVRVFGPPSWGSERGFRLKVAGGDGKTVEPNLHPPGPPMASMFKDSARFRELDVGESTSFRSVLKARDVFGAPGTFKLRAVYVPEPTRAFTKVHDAIVFENGPVESGTVQIKVV